MTKQQNSCFFHGLNFRRRERQKINKKNVSQIQDACKKLKDSEGIQNDYIVRNGRETLDTVTGQIEFKGDIYRYRYTGKNASWLRFRQ